METVGIRELKTHLSRHAEKYGLRGVDGIRLASFAEIGRSAGIHDTRFSSFDDRLNAAALKLTRTLARTSQK